MMISNNGYANIHGWELYDTTGTTDDWSYNSTGGYAFTFEIGPDEFHPPFAQVVDEYVGTGPYTGKGNREAYLVAFENAVSRTSHALISGKAPAGATLRLRKEFTTPMWSPENNFNDALESTMVTTGRSFAWDVNQSTRPVVQSRLIKLLNETPTRSETFTEIGSSGNFVGEKEKATINAPTPGTYVLRVINFASVTPTYTLTASLFNATEQTTPPQIESRTLTCEKDGQVLQTASIVIDRGQQVSIDLKECVRRFGR